MIRICLDAGHYGKYNRSPVNAKYYESDMTWKLHLYLKDKLEKRGCEVTTTRTNKDVDLGLESRGKKSKGCDLFLSLHSNATSSSSADYPVACCMIDDKSTNIDDISVELGTELAIGVSKLMNSSKKGTVWRRIGSGNTNYYGVLRGARSVGTPAILLEHGFHTNKNNTDFLLNDDNLKKIAELEADIIVNYFGAKNNNTSTFNNSFIPYCVKVVSEDGFVNIRKTPDWSERDIVGTIPTSNIKYTIVAETNLNGTKFGKLKSGAGWISLHEKYVEKV